MRQENWNQIFKLVLSLPAHTSVIVSKDLPIPPYFTKTIGEPNGQKRDYEVTLDDGRRIHIREYNYYYEVHWDYVSPKVNPIKHLRLDAKHWYDVLEYLVKRLLKVGRKF